MNHLCCKEYVRIRDFDDFDFDYDGGHDLDKNRLQNIKD